LVQCSPVKLTPPARSSWLGLLLLFALLATLAALQFHWTGELSRAEGERLRRHLDASAQRISHELDREITRAFLQFRPPLTSNRPEVEAHALAALADWEQTRFPDLVSGVVLIDRRGPVALAAGRRDGAWRSIPWPPQEGATVLAGAVASRQAEIDEPRRTRSVIRILAPDVPGLIYPWITEAPPDEPRRAGAWRKRVAGYVVVLFDRRALTEQVLPNLTDELLVRHWGPRPVSLEVPGRPEMSLSASPLPDGGPTPRDLIVPVFGLLPVDELVHLSWIRGGRSVDLGSETPRPDRTPRDAPPGAPRPVRYEVPWIGVPLGPSRAAASGWQLRFYDPGAAVDSAVEQARWRNLILGFGVLAVLGLSSAALVVFSRRTHRLAQGQLEFVAAVSHELRTPLAAIRALGQNLDDGVVREGEAVRQYGRRIVLESGRLGELVERTLALGGILSGRGGRNPEILHLDEVARRAAAECAPLAAQLGREVVLSLAAAPAVSADPMALHGAVVNLLVNAVRFGGGPVTLRVGGERRGRSAVAILAVSDRGPGIAKDDLPRLFEPFYRGQNALARRIPGSGLGLSLVRHAVEAAGGSVEVETGDGAGTTFTLVLPARGENERTDGATNPPGRR
jgi:signal transduction histidine kinase